MRFDIITLFPDMFAGPLNFSILKRAQEQGLVSFYVHDMRSVTTDKHQTVDDTPYGGGAGMVLKVDVMDAALKAVLSQPEVSAIDPAKRRVILLTPQGIPLTQKKARTAAASYEQITLVCGHYEGFDERIRAMTDSQLSIGDYVLTGGELPALVFIDTVTRLLPEVLHEQSPEEESFSLADAEGNPLLEYPHYTRPMEYDGKRVPDILLSGNHAAIKAWRHKQARYKTAAHLKKADASI
jgi:tRNA (guanine37-N1)-methyltransferase